MLRYHGKLLELLKRTVVIFSASDREEVPGVEVQVVPVPHGARVWGCAGDARLWQESQLARGALRTRQVPLQAPEHVPVSKL